MSSPATSPLPRAHHVPEAVHGLVAALAVLGVNATAMAVWWWGEQGTDTPTRTWLAGLVTAILVGSILALTLRHPPARRAAVGAVAVCMVLDALVIGYELAGLRR